MKKILSILVSILTLTLFTSNIFAAGDAENVKKVSVRIETNIESIFFIISPSTFSFFIN